MGRATFPSVLENAGAANTDMIIAVTKNDETNMIICQLAHSLFNINKKIARIRSKEFLEGKWSKLYNKSNLPIDVIISPEAEVAKLPTVCGSLREALESLDSDRAFLTEANVFTDDQIDGYIELKMQDVYDLEHSPHPIEFKNYFSV